MSRWCRSNERRQWPSNTVNGMHLQRISKACGALAAVALAAQLVSPASAQIGEYAQGEFYIEGIRAHCPDVTTIVSNRAEEVIAFPDALTILINATAFDALPPGVRFFLYYHTCGQIFYRDMALADGAAVRAGVAARWLSASDVEIICTTPLLTEIGWDGAPDPLRCEAIYQAMREALL